MGREFGEIDFFESATFQSICEFSYCFLILSQHTLHLLFEGNKVNVVGVPHFLLRLIRFLIRLFGSLLSCWPVKGSLA